MKQTITAFLTLCLISTAGFAQNLNTKLANAYNKLVNDPQAKYASTSLCVLDARTGETIFAKNEQLGLATASTLKTITAATAFSLLGADFRYETKLAYSGKINSQGVLQGDLIVIGSGDPTFGSERYPETQPEKILSTFASAIKQKGIKKIEGRIVADDLLFGTQTLPEGWIWQDIGNYFGAGSGSLAWRENQFDIFLKPGANVNDDAIVTKTDPEIPYLKIVNELKTGPYGSGDNAYAFLPPFADVAYLRGSWGVDIAKKSISVALPDAAYELARQLDIQLKEQQITVSEPPTTTRRLAIDKQQISKQTFPIYSHYSPNLEQLIYWFQKKSINLYGEQLLKTIALKSNKIPSTQNGATAEINFWANKGFDKNALNIIDGSGLSPATRVNTLTMAKIMFWAQRQPWFSAYLKSFPEYNGMTIKSGTINNVSAFAGYYFSGTKKYVVVININNYSGAAINKKLFATLDALK